MSTPLTSFSLAYPSLPLFFHSLVITNMSMNPMSSQQHHGAWSSWEAPMHLYHHFCYPCQEAGHHEREQMFEKSLTPSDVGKLNRLVIPKQHAEKYFPLDANSGEKELSLSFEDEGGKPWRFRYSYWSSSQSYVLTKGWSRFVKEKKLDAGDVVLFERLRGEGGDSLYIGCRRQLGANGSPLPARTTVTVPWSRVQCTAARSYPWPPGDQRQEVVQNVAVAPANPKRLRLFGVNLDCGPDSDDRHLLPASFLPTTDASSYRQH